MINSLILILIAGLILCLVYFVITLFVTGIFLKIALAILVLIFAAYIAKLFGVGL